MNMELNNDNLELDTVDLRILVQLQTDASISNQDLAAKVHVSPPTCLRRVKRLRDLGVIERQIALLSPDKLKAIMGHGLTAVVEVTLTQQHSELLEAFEARISTEPAVQQCYRVSPGPDFVLIVQVRAMPDYLALVQRVFTQDAQVRNVKAYFSVLRSKFEPALPLN
jgi:Lrp/AsnC family transcriptional regulator, leucine-responsive regulatory protein